jgi:DNA replication protein DnaC
MNALGEAKKIISDSRYRAFERRDAALENLRKNADFCTAESAYNVAKFELARAEIFGNITNEIENFKTAERDYFAFLASLGLKESDVSPSFSCPVCEDTGVSEGKPCKCVTRLIEKIRLENNPLLASAPALKDIDFSVYKDMGKHYKKTVSQLEKYFVEDNERGILFIFGAVGTGKTFIASALARALLLKGKSVFSCSSPALARRFLDYARASFEDKPDILSVFDSDVVFIDDLGREQVFNNITAPLLYDIVSSRAGKKLIITSNLTLKDIEERYGQPIMSRLCDNKTSIVVELTCEDLRI